MVDEDVTEPLLSCTLCGRPLGYSTDDQPYWPTGPMCGDCYQARETDNDMWADEANAEAELNADDEANAEAELNADDEANAEAELNADDEL